MRYRLRTLLILFALLPPLLAGTWWLSYREYARWQERQAEQRLAKTLEEMGRGLELVAQIRTATGGRPLSAEQRENILRMYEVQDRKSRAANRP
jgi:hypothetical protein